MKKLFTKAVLTGAAAIIVYLMVANLVFHIATGWQYGFFFDEFYYYTMSNHLDFGYMDVAPVTAWLMALSRLIMGDSIVAMHVFPAIAGSFAMLFAALTARKMGGGRFSQLLTALVVMLAPVLMTLFSMFIYDAFDQLMAAIVVFIVAKVLKGEATPRFWVLFGFVAGIGLLVKITIGFLLVCLIVGILLTRTRKRIATKWFWVSAAIAFACFIPYIVWQAVHGFPIYEYLRAYASIRTVKPSVPEMLVNIIIVMNPASILLWLGGLVLLFTKRGRTFRPFAWAFLIYFALAAILSIKFYALVGVLLPLIAFGAVCLERNYRRAPQDDLPVQQDGFPLPLQGSGGTTDGLPASKPPKKKKGRLSWALKVSYLVVLCLFGAAFAPLNLPMLSPQDTAVWNNLVGVSSIVRWDSTIRTEVPTLLAGRLGWEEAVQAVAQLYHSLPEAEQNDCTIYGSTYGITGALEYYGRKYGLPRPVSAHMGCYYWGHDEMDGKCVIFVGMGVNYYWELENYFDEIKIIPSPVSVPYSTLFINSQPVYVCRGLKIPLDEFWEKMRSYS